MTLEHRAGEDVLQSLAEMQSLAENAANVCGAYDALIGLVEGDVVQVAAHFGPVPSRFREVPLDLDSPIGEVILEQRVVSVEDALTSASSFARSRAQQDGIRSTLMAPLVGGDGVLGAIIIRRLEPGLFSARQIELLQTFASLAVMAIENRRLLVELETSNGELARKAQEQAETLDEQAATNQILEIISQSPAAVQPVLDAIVEGAARVTGAADVAIRLLQDGSLIAAAHTGSITNSWDPLPMDSGIHYPSIRAVNERTTIYQGNAPLPELRTVVVAPLLREGDAIGALMLYHAQPNAFTHRQIALLESFARQAVIAIENVRLFHEVEAKNAELEIASKHKSDFLANMSHELRTPLNAIISFSEMLQEDATDEGNEQYLPDLQEINGAGKHLLGLINDILDVSKIEAGRMDVYPEAFRVADLLREVRSLVLPLVEKNGNTLVVETDEELGEMFSDLTKVKQALLNLLSNAAKFTTQGTVKLVANRDPPHPNLPPPGGKEPGSPPPREGEGEKGGASSAPATIMFAVTNSGIGMTAEQIGRLFQAFSQADASTTRKFGGTGLGLAITRQFVQMLGGDVVVASEYGVGSTFTLTLPVDLRVIEGTPAALGGAGASAADRSSARRPAEEAG